MILYSNSAGRPTESAFRGTLARDRQGHLWEQTAPGEARHWERFSVNGPVSRVVWTSENIPLNPNDENQYEVDYERPLEDGDPYLYLTSLVVTVPLLVHGLVMPLTNLDAPSQVLVKAAIFECLPGDRKVQWPWRLFHPNATYKLETTETGLAFAGPFFVPMADPNALPVFLPAGRYFVFHIWNSVEDGDFPNIFGAKFAVRKARDARGSGDADHANIFVGDRVARGVANDPLDGFRNYDAINFAEITLDGNDEFFPGSNPYDSPTGLMACMDIGLQAEVYPA